MAGELTAPTPTPFAVTGLTIRALAVTPELVRHRLFTARDSELKEVARRLQTALGRIAEIEDAVEAGSAAIILDPAARTLTLRRYEGDGAWEGAFTRDPGGGHIDVARMTFKHPPKIMGSVLILDRDDELNFLVAGGALL